MKRGQIWWATLSEPHGSEPGYRRPVIVVQSDVFTASRIQTVLAVAITSNMRLAAAPGNVRLPRSKTGLTKDSVANISQVLTVDKEFLESQAGQLDRSLMRQLDDGLKLILDL